MCRTLSTSHRRIQTLSPFAISKSCAAHKTKDGTGPDFAEVVSLNVAKFVIFSFCGAPRIFVNLFNDGIK